MNNSHYNFKGRLVIETSQRHDSKTLTQERQWITTDYIQWKKPIIGRCIQVIILFLLGLFFLYVLYGVIFGGKVTDYPSVSVRHYVDSWGVNRDNKKIEKGVIVTDLWELKILEFTNVYMSTNYDYYGRRGYIIRPNFKVSDAKYVFRVRSFLILLLLIPFILLTVGWIQCTPFPSVKDIVPRDVADEIEYYRWDGLSKRKYIIFKKNGKLGIIDASNYCVVVPAQYDSIVWRIPNKTCDVTIGDDMQIYSIEKLIKEQC